MNMQEILEEFRIPYHTTGPKTRRGWINLKCPFCDRDPYLGYSISGRYFNCWNSGRHSIWETLQLLTHLSAKKVWELIESLPQERLPEHLIPKGRLEFPKYIESLREAHTDYLKERGFNDIQQLRKLWDIKGIGMLGGILRWRIFIPIYLRGNVQSWTTRAIGSREPRYYSAKDEQSAIPIENLLYGIDYVINSCVLVEGPVDVWKIGPGAIALLGQRCSPAQLEQLSKIPNRAICFDNEPEAQRRAKKLTKDLSVFPGKTYNVTLNSNDPGSADPYEIESLRKRFL